MKQPTNQKEVCCFVGMVNFYRNLYPKHAATLAPLTDLCGHEKKFMWGKEQEEAFSNMKQLLSQDTLLTYPQFDKPFVVSTDASEKRIGGVVTQDGKPLGFFSKKLTDTQRRYPVTEQELLAIVETLKYFKHMLLGLNIIVQTDHKNLTHPNSTHTSDRVLRQHLLLEEYGVDLQYIQGTKNVVADALSRLPTEELFRLEEEDVFPINLTLIAAKQATDDKLCNSQKNNDGKYTVTLREGVSLSVHSKTEAIYVPATLRMPILQWYHTTCTTRESSECKLQ
jgi:hypothetical protein